MIYVALVYFSWVLGAVVWLLVCCKWGRRSGLALVVTGAVVQLGALWLHVAETRRLQGEPDVLYVWIAPLVMASFGALLWIAGIFWQACGGRACGSERSS
jgi:hypothetical protein